MAQEWRLTGENVLFRIKELNRITLFFEVAFYAWDLALKLHNLKKKELKLLNRYLTMKKTSIWKDIKLLSLFKIPRFVCLTSYLDPKE